MSKARHFSIFLLKQGFDAVSALREDHHLHEYTDIDSLPEGSRIYLGEIPPRSPWWKDYFNISANLKSSAVGALIFLPLHDRVFALSFGHVSHNLTDHSFEYDFGVRVTLNSLEPSGLKSTDVLEPGVARRSRIQAPVGSELTFFDIDRDSTILKGITGYVKESRKSWFAQATGASNLRISSKLECDELSRLAEELLRIYELDDYKTAFPELQNVVPVRDPDAIEELVGKLLVAIKEKHEALALTVPDIINYNDGVFAAFGGAGRKQKNYSDVFIKNYYDYLEENGFSLESFDFLALSKHQLLLVNEDNSVRDRFSLLKSLVYEVRLTGKFEGTYHLNDGMWFRVEDAFVDRIRSFLDPFFKATTLPEYNHETEGKYNAAVAAGNTSFVCLDKKSIGPKGHTAVEPCDFLTLTDAIDLHHIKVSTHSNQLSHLFNQGVNSLHLLKAEKECADKLVNLVSKSANHTLNLSDLESLLGNVKFRIIFGIVTHKEPSMKSDALPIFSRISLMRALKELHVMSASYEVCFIPDKSIVPPPVKRGRKKNATQTPPPSPPPPKP